MIGKIVALIGLLLAACTAQPAPMDVHAAAIELVEGSIGDAAVIIVAEPQPELWDQWCGPESELEPCLALQAMTIDLAAPLTDAERADIQAALAPRRVEFVSDGAMLSLGRAIEVDGVVYLPMDGTGEGWLFAATATEEGWVVDTLAAWIA